jgi:hypothetical protein
MLKALVILSCELKSGVAKTGNPYSFLALQGVMEHADGRQEVFVYDWWAKKGEPLPDIKPGRYLPTLEPLANNQTRKLEARISGLQPLKAA